MGASASLSSSSDDSLPSKKYEVFLSFRGEDTRRSFTSHLHKALRLKGIETHIDYELPKGDDISQSLIQAIHDSSISVVIFSEKYASSKWCLNELIHILHCKQHRGQLVVPIFYEIDPSHVRNQTGTYEEAFVEYLKQKPEKVEDWREALFEIASLAGWDSRTFMNEAELIQNIVADITQKLKHPSSHALFANIVGMKENFNRVESLLEKFSIIGIWGMGGIGKTTLAKVVFAKLRSQFDSCCFLENLREEAEKHGLTYIREKLFFELSKSMCLGRFYDKKVFIVLDDVSSTSQLDYLKNEAPPLGPFSKVIITSRDRHVLDGRVGEIHKVFTLNHDNSLKLFNLKAFRGNGCTSEYKELGEKAVACAKGNPLALTILGSFLHAKNVQEWESALRKLEKATHKDIHVVLKLSYDGLDDEEKEMFLDIACFLKGEARVRVIEMLESYSFHGSIGLRTLMDKALISIDSLSRVQMHDLIQSMAFELVRQECVKDPGKRSRLWDPNEIYDVLKNNRGTDAIQGIILILSQGRDIQLSADTFKKMNNLRFLKFYAPWDRRSCVVNVPSGLDAFPNSIRYLLWDNFLSESLPPSFCGEKLVELIMPDSHLKKLWDGVQELVNLRKINLDGSKQLAELPDFSKAKNLKWVSLSSCESLRQLHPSILSLQGMHLLMLDGCINLSNLQSETHLKSLQYLNVNNCYSLKEFSLSSDKIKRLYLEEGIEILGSSMGNLKNLQVLFLNCFKLKRLPVNELCRLRCLRELHLYNCGEIIDKFMLHMLFDGLKQCLESLKLDGSCKLTELPNNIKYLSHLEFLSLRNCKSLQRIPELPYFIHRIDATNCTTLESLPVSIKHSMLKKIVLMNCRRLRSLPELPPFTGEVIASNCISLETVFPPVSCRLQPKFLFLENCLKLRKHSLSQIIECTFCSLKRDLFSNRDGSVCYPGTNVPEWFTYNQAIEDSNFITIELTSSVRNLQGFIFYCNISEFKPKQSHSSHLICHIYWKDGKQVESSSFYTRGIKVISHHAFLWSQPFRFMKLHETINNGDTNHHPKLTFKFSVVTPDENDELQMPKHDDSLIVSCGVSLVYASERHKVHQQMLLEQELESEYRKLLQKQELNSQLAKRKKRYRSIDVEQELFIISNKKLKESSINHYIPVVANSNASHNIDDLLFSLSQLNLEFAKDQIHLNEVQSQS